MRYMSTHDGRLHAFDADTGSERFTFVPTRLLGILPDPTSPSRTHKQSPSFGDAYIDGTWRTVLISSPGTRGKSVFALDITTPDGFSGHNLLWERTDTGFPHPRLSAPPGTVARMRDGTWAAVFGNGYDGAGGSGGSLCPECIRRHSARGDSDRGGRPVQRPERPSRPALLSDNQRTRPCRLCRGPARQPVEIRSLPRRPGTLARGLRLQGEPNPEPLFRATDGAGNPQPTLELEIGLYPAGAGYLIYFGAGSHHEVTPAGNRNHRRVVSNNPIDWSTSRGWLLDLMSPDGDKQGERLVGTPRLRGGHTLFTTLAPVDDRCGLGGRRRVMVLDAKNGGRIGAGLFDVSGDGEGSGADFPKRAPDGPSDAGPVPVSGRTSGADSTRTPYDTPRRHSQEILAAAGCDRFVT